MLICVLQNVLTMFLLLTFFVSIVSTYTVQCMRDVHVLAGIYESCMYQNSINYAVL